MQAVRLSFFNLMSLLLLTSPYNMIFFFSFLMFALHKWVYTVTKPYHVLAKMCL